MRVAALIGALCLVPCAAQSAVDGKLEANTMTLNWRPISCPGCPIATIVHPAGTLDAVGAFVGGPNNARAVTWNAPSAGDPTCRLRVSTGSGLALGAMRSPSRWTARSSSKRRPARGISGST